MLHTQTGFVSPQLHVKMDPSFHSVRKTIHQENVKILWPLKTGFVAEAISQREARAPNKGTKTARQSATKGPSPEGGTVRLTNEIESPQEEEMT